jgi:ATP-dependent Clp protease ATP-binding subunit ClpC
MCDGQRDTGNVFHRFTARARRVLILSQEEARILHHAFIGTEHILLGLIHDGEGVAATALDSLGISLEAARAKVAEFVGAAGIQLGGSLPFTPRAKKVLELSMREANQLGHADIDTEHILLGLVREGEGVAAQVLVSLGTDLGPVRQRVIQLMSGDEADSQIRRSVAPGQPRQSPICPQCRAELAETARFRTIATAPAIADGDQQPISIEVVYCGQCRVTLGVFKPDLPTADSV